MMFADADEVDAHFVGQHRLVNEVPDHHGVRKQRAIDVGSDVAKGVQSHIKLDSHLSAASCLDLEKLRRGTDPSRGSVIERAVVRAQIPSAVEYSAIGPTGTVRRPNRMASRLA